MYLYFLRISYGKKYVGKKRKKVFKRQLKVQDIFIQNNNRINKPVTRIFDKIPV